MNSLLASCIMFHYEINDIPHLSTTFDPTQDDMFLKSKQDIHLCVHLTSNQKKHFCEYLDLLVNDLPLGKYHSIHILESNPQTEDYYVQINNLCWNKLDDTKNHKIYINYKPSLFDDSWTRKYFLGFGSLFFRKNDIKSDVKIGSHTLLNKPELIPKLSKYLTLINCFSYATLYYVYKNADSHENILTRTIQKLINNPFESIFSMILDGTIYSIGGSILSNFYPYYSSILFNGFMMFVNYRLVRSIKLI